MRRWKAHRGKIASLSFSRDGQLLASVTGSGRDIFIWDATAGELVRKLTVKDVDGKPDRRDVLGAVFSPDVSCLAVARKYWVELWETDSWAIQVDAGYPSQSSPPYEITISPGANPCIATSSAYLMCIWRIGKTRTASSGLAKVEQRKIRNVSQLSFSADGDTLATHTREDVAIWNISTRQQTRHRHKPANYAGPVRFSHDSSRLAFCYSKVIESWPATLDDPDAVIRYAGHTDKVWMLRYTPDGRTLISASSDGTVRMWEASTGLEKRCFDMKIGKIAAADVSPDGAVAAVGGANGEIVVWDLE